MQECNKYNEHGQKHGYWEWYHQNGNLSYKGHYLNGEYYGYWEVYYRNGELLKKDYYARM